MLSRISCFRYLFAAAALAAPVLFTGCTVHARTGYRTYDPYDHQYRVWNPGEQTYYRRWATETHHNPNRNFRKMNKKDQDDYWRWRHDHH